MLFLFCAGWRLTQGPIELDFLLPHVEAALDRAGIGMKLSGLRFGINFSAHQLDLRADNVRLAAPDGTKLANLPQTSMSVALGPLLQGRLAPSSLTVEHPVLHLRRDAGGAISIALAPSIQPGDQTTEGAAPVALDRLLSPEAGDPGSALPRRLAIRGATVLIDDARTGRTWRADPVDIAVERGSEGLSGELALRLTLGTGSPNLRAAFRYAADSRRLDLDLAFDGVRPADIPAPPPEQAAPELAISRQIEAALSGTVRARIDLARGTAEAARADIAIGGGRLRSTLLPDGGVAIAGGALRLAYAAERGELRLETLRLDLGGGSELAVAGGIGGITPELIEAAIAGLRPPRSRRVSRQR